jgi:hypothetical protein
VMDYQVFIADTQHYNESIWCVCHFDMFTEFRLSGDMR